MYDPEPKKKMYVANFDSLDRLVVEGFLRKSTSPCGRLILYGYTNHCTYSRKWNKHTLNARGSVYELKTGKLVAKAFPKFFNFSELSPTRARNLLKQKEFDTFEKFDGSLGIIFKYDNKWMVNTRGSFISEQAVEGLEILKKYDLETIPNYITLLTEIIYPENKIIVDYGEDRKLVLLGAYNIYSGEELSWDRIKTISSNTNMPIPEKHTFDSINELIKIQKTLPQQEEGYVVKFSKSGERVKFKSLEYLKLARLMSYMTPLHFWEHMKNGSVSTELLEIIPEELREESDRIVRDMERKYREYRNKVYNQCSLLIGQTGVSSNQKKAIGILIKEQNIEHGKCAFSILDNKPELIDSYIMKRIRPKGNLIE